MRSFIIGFLVTLVWTATPTQGRTMDRCSLARELASQGVPYEQLAIWTCIAEHESSYRTGVVGPPNSDGSNDYGIFQINDRYWCQPPNNKQSANGCGVSCTALLSDDITLSVECAKKVLQQQGWPAWSTWKFCNGNLPSIDPCFK
ncbi:lysozyme P-like isoform X2 [Drosophila hydei]|uniref:lysozyme n=1 Tax=Drosophila hydei TaxID=7224 RepID=A0A6J2SUA3_DROHY|nr:lysozyme P-like isoform X2 [Drosophila hydei]